MFTNLLQPFEISNYNLFVISSASNQKNTTRVEIITTIRVENFTNIWAKVNNCDNKFNRVSCTQILNQDLEQGKLIEAVSARK